MDVVAAKCPVCGEGSYRIFELDGYPINSCSTCGHQFVSRNLSEQHANELYGDDYFFEGGAGYPNYLRLSKIVTEQGRQYAKILARRTDPGRVLDVGAASGFFLKGLIDSGWSGMGIEPNAHMAEFGRGHLGVDIRCGTLEGFETTDQFDLVTMIQVIGHLYDLSNAFEIVEKVTRPQGHCLVDFWDRDSSVARLFGKAWHEYSPPSVLHWFSQDDLDILFNRHGFIRIATGTPKKYIMGAHMKSLFDYSVASLSWARWLRGVVNVVPDELLFPYPPLDLKWALYKKADGESQTV